MWWIIGGVVLLFLMISFRGARLLQDPAGLALSDGRVQQTLNQLGKSESDLQGVVRHCRRFGITNNQAIYDAIRKPEFLEWYFAGNHSDIDFTLTMVYRVRYGTRE